MTIDAYGSELGECVGPQQDARAPARVSPTAQLESGSAPESGNQTPAAPPTSPQAVLRVTGPVVWPRVIGTLAIILGSAGILLSLHGLFTIQSDIDHMSAVSGPEYAARLEDFKSIQYAVQTIGVVIAAGLLTCGIGLIRRRRRWVRGAIIWSCIKLAFVVVSSATTSSVNEIERDASVAGDVFMMAMWGTTSSNATVMTSILLVAWGWLLPVFLLIWFTRAGVRSEVTDWT